MTQNMWKTSAARIAVCVGIAGAFCACGDDTSGTSGDGGENDAAMAPDTTTTSEAGSTDASKTETSTTDAKATDSSNTTPPDSSVTDAAMTDANTADTSMPDSARADAETMDASDASDANTVDAGPNLCAELDGIWGNLSHNVGEDWTQEFPNGPSAILLDGGANSDPNIGNIGFENASDCATDNITGAVFSDDDFSDWTNQLSAFEQRVFGCAGAPSFADAGVGGYAFALVPQEFTAPLSTSDLRSLSQLFVAQAIVVTNDRAMGSLTQAEINLMTQLVEAQESTYPDIVGTAPTQSTCPPDAGSD
jgi:hypothetical protein